MQILKRLFKVADEPPKQSNSDQQIECTSIVKHKKNRRLKRGEKIKLGCENFNPFAILCRRPDAANSCFYSTLNLRRVGSFRRRQRCWVESPMKMKKEDIARGLGIGHKVESATHVGNKVSPISDATLSAAANGNGRCGGGEKKDKGKGDKAKAMSKMKELLRWAAAAKAEKGGKFIGRKVLQFKNRATLKTVPDEDQFSNDSPKISFRWDVESCSTTSSVFSIISKASSTKINDQTTKIIPSHNSTPLNDEEHYTTRTGNWITTDSEFVVLEL